MRTARTRDTNYAKQLSVCSSTLRAELLLPTGTMNLLLGLIFSSVGGVYLFIGRRDHEPLYLIVGATLIFYPYFVTNAWLIVVIGIVLIAIPAARNRGWF